MTIFSTGELFESYTLSSRSISIYSETAEIDKKSKSVFYCARSLVEQSLVQRLSGLSSLHHNRHPFLSLHQRPGLGPVSQSQQDKQDLIRVTESKDDNEEDDDPGDDDDEKRKKKKTRTVFSRSQVSV